MNSLEDPGMIRLLYEALQAGVRVDLLVRGICCLVPGVEGVSTNIRVVSIVGRFLEHSRIYYFHNGGKEKLYLGSADLMSRNLDHRVEILFPVESKKLISRLRDEILGGYLGDTRNARQMLSDGTYARQGSDSGHFDSHSQFLMSRTPGI
jgi:polyphosphate kinase